MVAIKLDVDPTLAAADRALEQRENSKPRRDYLGMSALGHSCSRNLWYALNSYPSEPFDAATLKRFDDGHRSEDIMAARLRLIPGLKLWTVDEHTGSQIGMSDFDGKLKGHADGVVLGLLQSPNTSHVWEHKCVSDTKYKKMIKLKQDIGEKSALEQWDYTYYCQGVLYMDYLDITRHYMTIATPGTRDAISCRTEENPKLAKELREKARRIIEAKVPPAKISQSPDWFACKWCSFRKECHGSQA